MVPRMPSRALARGAALGSGGVGMLGLLGYALIRLEAKVARRAVPALNAAPLADGEYGDPSGVPLRIAMLGDSGAAGFGADLPEETPGALLASDLAASGRYVTLDVLAVTGARSIDLGVQVGRALLTLPDIALINIGANDITHWVPPRRAVSDLTTAIARLRAAGVRVVVATCPDLGALCFVPQPLRAYAGLKSAQMAAAQSIAVVQAGGVPVAQGSLLGQRFCDDPSLFCVDRFHPSGAGYREIAAVLRPAVRVAAGLDDSDVAISA